MDIKAEHEELGNEFIAIDEEILSLYARIEKLNERRAEVRTRLRDLSIQMARG